MARRPYTVQRHDGSHYRITRQEAQDLLHDNLAALIASKLLLMLRP